MRWLAIALIRLYQLGLRRFIRRRCLFEPSCSRYALAAFRAHGFRRGLALTRQRLAACRAPAQAAWTLSPHGSARLVHLVPPDGVHWDTIPARLTAPPTEPTA